MQIPCRTDYELIVLQKKTFGADYYGLEHDTPTDHGTTHLSVVDQWGGAASVTSTVCSLKIREQA